MDCQKVGRLILQLRKEKGLTQRQLAEMLSISNKTVSKWECGNGAPDASIWDELSTVLGADLLKLLQGELHPNRLDVGKMDKIRFYVCPSCGNILTSTGKANISCCGRHLQPLEVAETAEALKAHEICAEDMDGEYYISLEHEMSKAHYLAFAAYVLGDRVWFMRLYPEQSSAFHMPRLRGKGALYLYCTRHGLFRYSAEKITGACGLQTR